MCFLNHDTQREIINFLDEIGFYNQPIIKKLKRKRNKNKLDKAEKIILMDFFIHNFKNVNCNIRRYFDCEFSTCKKKCMIKNILKMDPPRGIYMMPGGYNTVSR